MWRKIRDSDTMGSTRSLTHQGSVKGSLEVCSLQSIPKHSCVNFKKHANMNTNHANTCSILIGKFEEKVFYKRKTFAPVLFTSYLCLLVSCTIERKCIFHRDNWKKSSLIPIPLTTKLLSFAPPKETRMPRRDNTGSQKNSMWDEESFCKSGTTWSCMSSTTWDSPRANMTLCYYRV